MDIVKLIGIGLISLVIIIIVKQYKPEFALYVSLAASILILTLVFEKLFSVINLLTNIANKTAINTTFIALLIKITGIAILTEFAVSICKDCGESAIASKMDIGGKIMIVTVSIPIISSLLETVVKVLPWDIWGRSCFVSFKLKGDTYEKSFNYNVIIGINNIHKST